MADRTSSTDEETAYTAINWWCKLCNRWYPLQFKHRHLVSSNHVTEKIARIFKNCVS